MLNRTLPTALALSHSLVPALTNSASDSFSSSSGGSSSTSRSTSSLRSQFSWDNDWSDGLGSSDSQTDHEYSRPATPKSHRALDEVLIRHSFLNLDMDVDCDLDMEQTPKPPDVSALEEEHAIATVLGLELDEEGDLDLGYESEAEYADAQVEQVQMARNRNHARVRGRRPKRSSLGPLDINSPQSYQSSSEDEEPSGRNQVCHSGCQGNLDPPPKPRLNPQALPEELSPVIDLPPLLLPFFPPRAATPQYTQDSHPCLCFPRGHRLESLKEPRPGEKGAVGTVTVSDALEDMLGFGYGGSALKSGEFVHSGVPTPPDSEEEEDVSAIAMFTTAMRELNLLERGVGVGR